MPNLYFRRSWTKSGGECGTRGVWAPILSIMRAYFATSQELLNWLFSDQLGYNGQFQYSHMPIVVKIGVLCTYNVHSPLGPNFSLEFVQLFLKQFGQAYCTILQVVWNNLPHDHFGQGHEPLRFSHCHLNRVCFIQCSLNTKFLVFSLK